jgi:hypothetical protein
VAGKPDRQRLREQAAQATGRPSRP